MTAKYYFYFISVFAAFFALSACSHSPQTDLKPLHLQEALKRQKPNFNKCYQDRLKKEESLKSKSGRIVLNWEINASGRAQNIRTTRDDMRSGSLIECFKKYISRMRFKTFGKNYFSTVEYPVTFQQVDL